MSLFDGQPLTRDELIEAELKHAKKLRGGALMDDSITEETETKAKQLGMTALELRALVKPLFMALYDHNRTSITIERHGTLVNVVIL